MREFAFKLPPSPDGIRRWKRHLSFKSTESLEQAVRYYTGGKDVYASLACYWSPTSVDMGGKRLAYADLSFDLDYDGMPSILAEQILGDTVLSDVELVQRVQEITIKLRDFLVEDMWFDRRSIQEVFSGGRGFHLHVRPGQVEGDDQHDRYIYGLGVEDRRRLMEWIRDGLGVTVDPTVTADMHRVIRVPGSIHSRTGLECQVVDLDTFDVEGVFHGTG